MQENEVQTPDAAQSPQYLDGTLLSKMAHGGAAVLKNKAEEGQPAQCIPCSGRRYRRQHVSDD